MKRPRVLADHQAQTHELELIFIFYFLKREDDLSSISIFLKKIISRRHVTCQGRSCRKIKQLVFWSKNLIFKLFQPKNTFTTPTNHTINSKYPKKVKKPKIKPVLFRHFQLRSSFSCNIKTLTQPP
jgi:hypothetical protein